jgi:gliding motility-associated lipoprotein GldD
MKLNIVTLFLIISLCVSCGADYTPKPVGYFRIDLPEKTYLSYTENSPFSFEYPIYSRIVKADTYDEYKIFERFNIAFDSLNADLHISYIEVDNNLSQLVDDANEFVYKHVSKANAIESRNWINIDNNVFGSVFEIEGRGAASQYQFYLTDSTQHFLRGALYFRTKPNNDSLAPVIKFIRKDIDHFIESFSWQQ